MLRFLCLFIFCLFINLAADDKDYLFVLSKPLSDQLNIMGIGIDALESNQPLQIISSNFLTQLNVNGISKLMFHRKRKVFGKRTNLSSALKLSSGTHDYDYIYRVILKEEYVESLIRAVQSLDSFIHIQPNYKYTITTTKADAVAEPRYSIQQTGIELMNFPDVWDVANGSGIVVAVLDTGLKIDHEEFCPSAGDPDNDVAVSDATTDYLNGCVKVVHPQDMVYSASFSSVSQIVPGEDYYTRDSYPGDDYSGHGTHVSGIIGASVNDNGIAGAAFGAQIMPVRVMYSIYDDLGNITGTGSLSDIVDGIDYAVEQGADIINLSLGSAQSMGAQSDLLFLQAVQDAVNQGVLVLAAAGNDSINIDDYGSVPSSFSETMTVSSVSNTGSFSSFSSFGESVDVAAFGGEEEFNNCTESSGVYSTYKNSDASYASLCGTSMATPYVAGLAALIKGYYKDNFSQTLTPAEIRRLINSSASRSSSDTSIFYGNGIIDAKNAFFMAGVSSFNDATSSEFVMGSGGVFSELLCYPNPFDISQSATTNCTYYLNQAADISYTIISRRGRLIKRGVDTGVSVGKQTFQWNGKDQSSNSIPKGVYQLIFTATTSSNDSWTQKHMITVL